MLFIWHHVCDIEFLVEPCLPCGKGFNIWEFDYNISSRLFNFPVMATKTCVSVPIALKLIEIAYSIDIPTGKVKPTLRKQSVYFELPSLRKFPCVANKFNCFVVTPGNIWVRIFNLMYFSLGGGTEWVCVFQIRTVLPLLFFEVVMYGLGGRKLLCSTST